MNIRVAQHVILLGGILMTIHADQDRQPYGHLASLCIIWCKALLGSLALGAPVVLALLIEWLPAQGCW